MKHCSYCGKPIAGKARPIADHSANLASAQTYWHDNPAECARRVTLPPEATPLQRYARQQRA